MRLAFLTCSRFADLSPDDRLAIPALRARGIDIVPWVWDAAPPGPVDAVMLRSCWDYYERPQAFLRFIDDLSSRGLPVYNPAPIVRWNMDKAYLRDIAARDVHVPRTLWIDRGDAPNLAALLDAHDLDEVVIKPRVSLSAVDTWRSSRARAAADQARFAALTRDKALLVQAFLPEIADGEISLLFFAGRFSHAVRKTPAPGDFRVQSDHGGTRALVDPHPSWIAEAERVLASLATPLLYARVDVVPRAGQLVWMELELIDPELFFTLAPEAPTRLAEALASICARPSACTR